jgi:hypothetical protein
MAHTFSPIPAKSAFGNILSTDYASDYIRNKKAKLAYCNKKVVIKQSQCQSQSQIQSQSDLLLYNQGQLLYNYTDPSCNVSSFNSANLVAGLYTQENLEGVNVLSDILGNTPTTIDNTYVPFYSYYNIDPSGQLFGNTTCGIINFTNYMSN